MRLVAPALAAAAVIALALGTPRPALALRVRPFLEDTDPPRRSAAPEPDLRRLGASVIGGALAGVAAVTGVTDAPMLSAVAAGAAAGWLLHRAATRRGSDRRSAATRAHVPVTADAIALHVVAGSPVPEAAGRVAAAMSGPVAADLAGSLRRYAAGASFEEAMTAAATGAAHPDAARLYEALANAHGTGGRLADTLAGLASDVRAGIARDLTAEGGRRALVAYAPILALMIPVTVLFLMYPTLVSLTMLAGSATP